MTPEQIERWKFVTKSYCYGARPEATTARKQRLWREAESFIEAYKNEPVDGWDNDYCLCDYFSEWFSDHEDNIWVEKNDWLGGYGKESPRYFANHLRAAIRAGINAAVNDGLGVIGFTVGEVKKMFSGEIPEWFACQYKACLTNTNDHAGIAL